MLRSAVLPSELIRLACLAEARSPKPGNVHPAAAFADMRHEHFVAAAETSAEPLAAAGKTGVGPAVLAAVQASREATGTNANLGIALLLAPLAAVPDGEWPDVGPTLRRLTVADARAAYEAIRVAEAGGMGEAESQDIAEAPTVTLLDAMRLAADRDEIARLYATDFADLFARDVPALLEELDRRTVPQAVVAFFVRRLARVPDTLIARKCGLDVAAEASRRAATDSPEDLDRWLRGDGHRRNPGATADVTAATLYAALRSDPAVAARVAGWLSADRPPLPKVDLGDELWRLAASVPSGRVTSFGRLARGLGDAKAAVWAARELTRPGPRHRPPDCPCLRVRRADGSVPNTPCRTGPPADGDWFDFDGPGPLAALRAWQDAVEPPPPGPVPGTVAGMDVSYPDDRPSAAVAVVGEDLEWSAVVGAAAPMPYVSGYLTFRELPALLAAYRHAKDCGRWPGLAMIDGAGRLHPRRAGVAACFSAATGEPAVGVTKRYLCGDFDRDALAADGRAEVSLDGEVVGVALRPATGGAPLFVSPGGGMTVADAERIALRHMTAHRVPEPIYWADRLSRRGVPVN